MNEATLAITLHILSASKQEFCSVMLTNGIELEVRGFGDYIRIELLVQEVMSFVRSYVLPEGFPDSVTSSYVPYMTWRALKVVIFFYEPLLRSWVLREMGTLSNE